jgi:hypothetical protein
MMASSASPPRISELVRHPSSVAMSMSAGTKTNWPADVDAPNMPITRPRRVTNQRVATVAPNTPEMMPVPTPLTPPQRIANCKGVWM